jgi:predicted GNAT superfamily acetyltransferase
MQNGFRSQNQTIIYVISYGLNTTHNRMNRIWFRKWEGRVVYNDRTIAAMNPRITN